MIDIIKDVKGLIGTVFGIFNSNRDVLDLCRDVKNHKIIGDFLMTRRLGFKFWILGFDFILTDFLKLVPQLPRRGKKAAKLTIRDIYVIFWFNFDRVYFPLSDRY